MQFQDGIGIKEIILYPRKVEVWLVMSTDTIIDNLEFFGCVDGQTSHIFDATANGFHMRMFVLLEPGAFADSVMRYFDFTGLVILHGGSPELRVFNERLDMILFWFWLII